MDLVEPIEIPTNPVRFRLVLVQVQVEFVVVVRIRFLSTYVRRTFLSDGSTTSSKKRKQGPHNHRPRYCPQQG